ncbi:unnamed protein product [Fraxinus pennsylvanica]|uniref:Protein WUSCHEL n=1 Tax=Fraxinus pennsylvanica TaxID=56036 RepID=A0AAD2EDK6_9LAMI|nr:unnamed protein product [Fraxinus pennsylvanica]
MASSNRNWPSMFKSKPKWQHENMNSSLISTGCHRTPNTSVPGYEERTPEPKPRWNPRPEQIRLLEAIFNSGMVNPPRDEIRKIRAQLEQYGQVGDANVFYWFQNRKSRSKQKNRQLHKTKSQTHHTPPITTTTMAATASISTPSDKSSLNNSTEKAIFSAGYTALMEVSNSTTGSANQSIFQTPSEFGIEPYFFPMQQSPSSAAFTEGFCFPDVSDHITDHADVNCCSSLLLSEMMLMNHEPSKKAIQNDHENMKLLQQLSNNVTTAPNSTHSVKAFPPTLCFPSPMNHIQGVGESGGGGPTKSTVFIDDVCFEVAVEELFNVREAFGDDAVLVHSSGQPVLTNEWGVALQPLQHGAFYYLVRAFTPSSADERTIELAWHDRATSPYNGTFRLKGQRGIHNQPVDFVHEQIAYFDVLPHGLFSSPIQQLILMIVNKKPKKPRKSSRTMAWMGNNRHR